MIWSLVRAMCRVSLIGAAGLLLLSCTLLALPEATGEHSADAALPSLVDSFPLHAGATWIYTTTRYDIAPGDATTTITATYRTTESVTAVDEASSFTVLSMLREETLLSQDELPYPPAPMVAYWYVISGTQLFLAYERPDFNAIEPAAMELAFDFPLTPGKQWCPDQLALATRYDSPVEHCGASGRRTVSRPLAYTSAAGAFDDCCEILEEYNSGGVTHWLCPGVGIVASRYDHRGTPFGFASDLYAYRLDTP